MKAMKISATLLLVLAVAAFAGKEHDHGADTHSHDQPGANVHSVDLGEDDGHGADAPTVAVTQWSDKMELFMEYPLLVAGEPGRFIIHLTILDGFQPVRDGSVVLILASPSGESYEIESNELLREGIFAPSFALPEPGAYEFVLSYHGAGASGVFYIDGFVVYADANSMPAEAKAEASDGIGFLKEQQWKVPFATAQAEVREMKHAVWAIGKVLPSPNAYAEIVAPVDGIVQIAAGDNLALPGSAVRRGDVVATITPPVQGQSWVASRLAYEQASRDYDRAQRLKELDAISDREFEQTQNEFLTRKAGFEGLVGGGAIDVLGLEAPISGKIIEWRARPGQLVRAGDKLMAVVDASVVWLEVNVYQDDFSALGRPVGAWVKDAQGGWSISAADMRVLTTGGALDAATRTVPVLLEVANGDGRLTVNESTPVELYASDGDSSVAVPRAAVYQDAGVDIVFVQTGGESFEKRQVELGPHYAGWVSVRRGLGAEDRVVARGGYHVKLASTSAEIGHGHTH